LPDHDDVSPEYTGKIHMADFTLEMKEILDIESHEEILQFIQQKYSLQLKQDNFPDLTCIIL
jgi:hypothetical protein